MIQTDVSFFSEGSRLLGSLYRPDDIGPEDFRGALVVSSGYQGFNSFYPRLFARPLTERGFVCLGFDYRGMADSEGDKGRVLIEEQVQDVRNALTFLRSQDDVDAVRVGLVGWGMGAANVILAGQKDGDVAGVASLNGFYNGRRWLQAIHTYDEYCQILDEIAADRRQRVLEGESKLADTFEHYPLDPATRRVVEEELAPVFGFGHPTRLQFTESILDLDVDRVVAALSPAPLFIGHGARNALHPYAEAEHLYAAAASPKTLYTIDGRHNDFMFGDHPEFALLCAQLEQFFGTAFAEGSTRRRTTSA